MSKDKKDIEAGKTKEKKTENPQKPKKDEDETVVIKTHIGGNPGGGPGNPPGGPTHP